MAQVAVAVSHGDAAAVVTTGGIALEAGELVRRAAELRAAVAAAVVAVAVAVRRFARSVLLASRRGLDLINVLSDSMKSLLARGEVYT